MIRLIVLLVLGLTASCMASLHLGLRIYTPEQVWTALHGEIGADALIIRDLRLPRTLLAAICGAALGISGLSMQAVTRNPLAEPGLLGVNAGAAFAVTLGLFSFALHAPYQIAALAIVGAVIASLIVFGIAICLGPAGGNGTILLVGVTVAAMLSALTQVMLLLDEAALETLLFWLSGGFADRPTDLMGAACVTVVLSLVICGALSRDVDALRLDDQSAQSIGVHVIRVRIGALVLAAVLAAISVAVAGPIAFLGLIAPHLTRLLAKEVWPFFPVALMSALLGAILAVLADILARLVVAPGEAPIGAVVAVVGAPFLLALLGHARGRVA